MSSNEKLSESLSTASLDKKYDSRRLGNEVSGAAVPHCAGPAGLAGRLWSLCRQSRRVNEGGGGGGGGGGREGRVLCVGEDAANL